MIEMVRKPSDTPNITNIDDIIAMRYAYGNQDGYIKGKGTELSYTVNGLDFIINSGRFVVQGVEADIDSNGVTITIDNVSSLRYHIIYAEVNLGINTVQIKHTFDSLGYPVMPTSQDLTKYSNGTAYLKLYEFTSSGNAISSISKKIKEIEYYYADGLKTDLENGNVIVNNSKHINGILLNKDLSQRIKVDDAEIISRRRILRNTPVNISAQDNQLQNVKILAGDYANKELQFKIKHLVGESESTFWEYTCRAKFGESGSSMIVYSYSDYTIQIGYIDTSTYPQGLYAEASGSATRTYITEVAEIIE